MRKAPKRRSLLAALVLVTATAGPAAAGEPLWWTQQKQQCGLPAGTLYNDWVAQGSPCGGGAAVGGGLAPGQQMMLQGASNLGFTAGQAVGQALGKAMFGDPQAEAAAAAQRQAAQAAQAAAAQAAAQAAAARAAAEANATKNRLLSEMKGVEPVSDLQIKTDDDGGGLQMKTDDQPPQVAAPPPPPAKAPDMVATPYPALPATTPEVADPTVGNAFAKAREFLVEKGRDAVFAIVTDGDMALKVMYNAGQLPSVIFPKIGEAAAMNADPNATSMDEANRFGDRLTVTSVRTLFDVDAGEGKPIAKGFWGTDAEHAEEGGKDLFSAFFPKTAEVVGQAAENAPALTGDLKKIAGFWTGAEKGDGQ